jgi:hypothetical protein
MRAIARMQPATARLNGSVGDSLDGVFGLMFEDISFLFVIAGLDPAIHPSCEENGCAGQARA